MSRNLYIKIGILILFSVGFILHITCVYRGMALQLTTMFLLLVNSLILYTVFSEQKQKMRLALFLIFAFVFTVFLEILGSKTGLVFGFYQYGETMSLKLAGVPLVIGFNWVILSLASYNLSIKTFEFLKIRSSIVHVLFASSLLTLLDYFIEPVAIFLDYWTWEQVSIPIQNYIAWFLISLVLFTLLKVFKIDVRAKLLPFYFFLIMAYFILLGIFLKAC